MPDRKTQFLKLRADIISNFKLSEKKWDWLYPLIANQTTTQRDIVALWERKWLEKPSVHRIYRITKHLREYFEKTAKEDYEFKIGVGNKKV